MNPCRQLWFRLAAVVALLVLLQLLLVVGQSEGNQDTHGPSEFTPTDLL